MFYQCISRIRFLLSSTNQHGVHSPFVYDYLTKCLYLRDSYSGKKSFAVLLKSIRYFGLERINIGTSDQFAARELEKYTTDIKINTPPYDAAYLSITDWINQEPVVLENLNKNDQALILLLNIHKNKTCQKLWKTLVQSDQFNVSIDMYNCGALFIRRQQRKQHFKVRI